MDFDTIQKRAASVWKEIYDSTVPVIYFGAASCGVAAGIDDVKNKVTEHLDGSGIEIKTLDVGCIGLCCLEPLIYIQKPGLRPICYHNVKADQVGEILDSYLINDDPVAEMALGILGTEEYSGIPPLFEHPILKPQIRLVLRNCGIIDPTSIDHYIANAGYSALIKVLEMTQEEVIDEIKESGLRGRGGAGFPTAIKWDFCRKAEGQPKYLICNADEGDPGAFMNRSLLEGDPHAVLEGMLIAAYAIGASKGYIYVRAEYPLAIKRLNIAIEQMKANNLLGERILDTDFSFNILIKEGAGAFVCGEETALMASIEGKRGMPRPRPPFPANSGLWGKPTNINNVETLGSLANIIRMGGKKYAERGSETTKGTKTFSLVGKVNNTGLIEVPLGTKIKDIIYEIGGGIPNGKRFKAVQCGGPSGGCIPSSKLDIGIDYESLTSAGAIMGSGGLVVMDEDTCMVDMARFFLSFTQDESCGKCTPCRVGTKRMLELLEKITEGRGEIKDLEKLKNLGDTIKKAALCGLGQTAPNSVLSTLRYFEDEYVEHILAKKCRSAVCQELFLSPCQNTCPAETNVPGYIQLMKEGRFVEAYKLNRESNPFPSVCGRVCFHPCENRCRRNQIDKPISVMALKRICADRAFGSGDDSVFNMRSLEGTGKKVAVVGAGPSGLTAAYFLKRLGHEVDVYEAQPVPGGMMQLGIPPYRLPKDVVQKEIKAIEDMGVRMHTGKRLGREIDIGDLRKENDAIYLAFGFWDEFKLGIENEDAEGVIGGLEILREVGLENTPRIGNDVVVIGGGNTAIDVSRTCKRLGADVKIFYRRERKDMPAFEEEIEEALEEGIELITLVGPVKVLTDGVKVTGLRCIRMSLGEFDGSGRRRPIPVEGSEFDTECDVVITAIGQKPDTDFLESTGVELRKDGSIVVDDRNLMTSKEGIFAGGDVSGSDQTVIQAIADGRKTAGEIDEFLTGSNRLDELIDDYDYGMVTPNNQGQMERQYSGKEEPLVRISNFKEVCPGYSENECLAELERCLRCDIREEPDDGKNE